MLTERKTSAFLITRILPTHRAITQQYGGWGYLRKFAGLCLVTAAWVVNNLFCLKAAAPGLRVCFVWVYVRAHGSEGACERAAIRLAWPGRWYAWVGRAFILCLHSRKNSYATLWCKAKMVAREGMGRAPWESWHLLVLSEVRTLNAMSWPAHSWNISRACHLANWADGC